MTTSRLAALGLFAGVSVVHFFVCVAGQALALRVAFDSQPGGTVRPFDVAVVRAAEILLAPLTLAHRLLPGLAADYLEIAVTSATFGAIALGV